MAITFTRHHLLGRRRPAVKGGQRLEGFGGVADLAVGAVGAHHLMVLLPHEPPRVLPKARVLSLAAVALPDGAQVVVRQVEVLEVLEIGDRGGHVAAHLIVIHVEPLERDNLAYLQRQVAGEGVVREQQ